MKPIQATLGRTRYELRDDEKSAHAGAAIELIRWNADDRVSIFFPRSMLDRLVREYTKRALYDAVDGIVNMLPGYGGQGGIEQ